MIVVIVTVVTVVKVVTVVPVVTNKLFHQQTCFSFHTKKKLFFSRKNSPKNVFFTKNSKAQIVMKLKMFNCEETQIV